MLSSYSAFSRSLSRFFLCALLFLTPIPCEGRTIYHVTQSGGAEPRDGLSWVRALGEGEFVSKLADPALADAEFWVTAGRYRPTAQSSQRDASFVLRNGVALYGGFAGVETERHERNWRSNRTFLTGDITGNDVTEDGITIGVRTNNSYNVVVGNGTDASAVLDGFIVTGGNADGASQYGRGGGLYIRDGSPTVINCIFAGNRTDGNGGGVFARGGAPLFEGCHFFLNVALASGGGMYSYSKSKPTLKDCLFSQNRATSGGGLFSSDSQPGMTVSACVFSDNTATSFGGGMYNGGSHNPVFVTDCTFSGNVAEKGGGLYDNNAHTVVAGCTFSGNSAVYGGGGVFNDSGDPVLTNCTFSGNNTTSGSGGGLYSSSGAPAIVNCTFFGNSAVTVGDGGGGLFVFAGLPVVVNSIFWDNMNGEIDVFTGTTTLENSIFRGWSGEAVNIVAENAFPDDPILVGLEENGGPTRTHALGEGSGALYRGIPSGEQFVGGRSIRIPSFDQRGVARPRSEGVDIGAFECAISPQEPSPEPAPAPTPSPQPSPDPEPLPLPTPEEGPFPDPAPQPVPAPSPEPEPVSPPGHDPVRAASGGGCAAFQSKGVATLFLLPLLLLFRLK